MYQLIKFYHVVILNDLSLGHPPDQGLRHCCAIDVQYSYFLHLLNFGGDTEVHADCMLMMTRSGLEVCGYTHTLGFGLGG